MNKILYIFLLLGELVFAQNPNDFEKIVFEYNHEHEYGTNKGIFSKEQFFELTKSNTGNFIFEKNIQTIKTFNGKIVKTKTKKIKNQLNVDKENIIGLFSELNINKDNFTLEYIKPKINKPKVSLIKKLIKEKSFILNFEKKIISKEQKRKIINEILEFNELKEFIEFEKPKANALYGMVDGVENLKISFIIKNDTTIYKAETFHKCGQPINLIENNTYNHKIINLDVNAKIEYILPKKSLIRNEFNLNNITEKYIRWYIDKNF
jgi:hypothetical protein